MTREDTLRHCRAIVAATPIPVSADLEKGFGDSPDSVAETIRTAAEIGLAGCSIEDYTGQRDDPIFDFGLAVERIAAAAQARNTLSADFVLMARCENFLWDRRNLDDTIRRLQAFDQAGADVLYAPGQQQGPAPTISPSSSSPRPWSGCGNSATPPEGQARRRSRAAARASQADACQHRQDPSAATIASSSICSSISTRMRSVSTAKPSRTRRSASAADAKPASTPTPRRCNRSMIAGAPASLRLTEACSGSSRQPATMATRQSSPLDPRSGANPDQGAWQPWRSAVRVASTAPGSKLSAPSGSRTCRWSSAAPAATASTTSSTIASTVTGKRG